jgi:integrase
LLDRTRELIQNEIKKLATLNQSQYLSLSQIVEELKTDYLDEIQKGIQNIEEKITKKQKNKHVTLPLRDPIARDIYEKIMQYVPTTTNTLSLVSYAQFRIVAALLFVTGCRLNEMRQFTLDDFEAAFKEQRILTIQTKTHQPRFTILGEKALNELNRIKSDVHFLFHEMQFKYLGACLRDPNTPMKSNSWIRSINTTLKRISQHYNIMLILKSHSFRIGYVTRHLRVSDIQKTADIIGHRSLNTRYNRYLLDNDETKQISDKAADI